MDAVFKGDLKVDYRGIETPEQLEHALRLTAAEGPDLEHFPWRLTTQFQSFLEGPSPHFPYAEYCLFCKAEAARNILNPQMCPTRRLLTGMLRHQLQIGGMFHEHLAFWHSQFLTSRHLAMLPDCAGRSLLDFDDTQPEEALRNNRAEFTLLIRRTGLCFQRTVTLAGTASTSDRIIAHHPLKFWQEGAGMPPAAQIPVYVEHCNGHISIQPGDDDAFVLGQQGWPMPIYEVARDSISQCGPRCACAEAAAGEHSPPWPVAAQGVRYAVSRGADAIFDKRTGHVTRLENINTIFALQTFLSIANGRENAKQGTEILDRIRAQRKVQHVKDESSYEIVHYFQTCTGRRRSTLPIYRAIIRNAKGRGLYWLEL